MTDPRIEAAARALFNKVRAKVTVERSVSICDYDEILDSDKEYWREDARICLAAADAAAWRPMSEAPRDGTVINVLLPEGISKADQDFYCYPGSRVSFGWAWENRKFRPCAGLTVFIQPTHWQPLPASSVVDVGGDDE